MRLYAILAILAAATTFALPTVEIEQKHSPSRADPKVPDPKSEWARHPDDTVHIDHLPSCIVECMVEDTPLIREVKIKTMCGNSDFRKHTFVKDGWGRCFAYKCGTGKHRIRMAQISRQWVHDMCGFSAVVPDMDPKDWKTPPPIF